MIKHKNKNSNALADEIQPLLESFFASDEYAVKHGFLNRAEECKWGAIWFLEWLRSEKSEKAEKSEL